MQARLTVVSGETEKRAFELTLPAVIGRSRSADVTLSHPLVSRQHCEVFEVEGALMVRDLGSRNGTFVGETRITDEASPVKPGELLVVGGVTFRADYTPPPGQVKPPTWNATGPTVESPLPDKPAEVGDTTTRREPRGGK